VTKDERKAAVTARMERLYQEGWTCIVGRPGSLGTAISPSFEAMAEQMLFPGEYFVKWIPPRERGAE
jgi:hypothetical protein